jgi:hypothetical protein
MADFCIQSIEHIAKQVHDAADGGMESVFARVRETLTSYEALIAEVLAVEPSFSQTACRRGCGYCCHQWVLSSTLELLFVYEALHGSPAELLHLQHRARQGCVGPYQACILLDAGECSAYPLRPLACRGYVSDELRLCLRLHCLRQPLGRVNGQLLRTLLADSLSQGLELGASRLGLQPGGIDFRAGLRALLLEPRLRERWWSGEAVFKRVGALGGSE